MCILNRGPCSVVREGGALRAQYYMGIYAQAYDVGLSSIT
jgi:hypothetical protein